MKAAAELAVEKDADQWLVIGGGSFLEDIEWHGHTQRLTFNALKTEPWGATTMKVYRSVDTFNIEDHGLVRLNDMEGGSHV